MQKSATNGVSRRISHQVFHKTKTRVKKRIQNRLQYRQMKNFVLKYSYKVHRYLINDNLVNSFLIPTLIILQHAS